jgi:hypothetical protein
MSSLKKAQTQGFIEADFGMTRVKHSNSLEAN